jgi:hypothetical protein
MHIWHNTHGQCRKQVPAQYFMVTFAVPAQLRALFFYHQRRCDRLLFACTWGTLHTFSRHDKQLKGTPGDMPCCTRIQEPGLTTLIFMSLFRPRLSIIHTGYGERKKASTSLTQQKGDSQSIFRGC